MSDQESPKKETEILKGTSIHKDASLDIENALSFIDSEEYEEASPPAKRAEPSSQGAGEAQPIQDKGPKPAEEVERELPPSPQIEKESEPKPLLPTDAAKEKKGSTLWIIILGAAILIALAILFLT